MVLNQTYRACARSDYQIFFQAFLDCFVSEEAHIFLLVNFTA